MISTRPFTKTPPMEYSALRKLSNSTDRVLKHLSTKDAEKLVSKKLGIPKVPSKIMEIITSKAEGHSLYIEKLIHSMLDQNLIKIDENGSCSLSKKLIDEGVKNFPDNLQQVVSTRIDNLSPKLQMTIKVCSVIADGNPEISPELVAAVHFHFESKEEATEKVKQERKKLVENQLNTLSEAGFFLSPEPGNDTFTFAVSFHNFLMS